MGNRTSIYEQDGDGPKWQSHSAACPACASILAVYGIVRAPQRPKNLLALGLTPRGLTREQAAEYVGVTPGTFDTWRGRRLLPPPMRSTQRWDIRALDRALDNLDQSGLLRAATPEAEDPYFAALKDL